MKKRVLNIIKVIIIILISIFAAILGTKIQSNKIMISASEIKRLSDNNQLIGEKGYVSSAVITQRKTGTGPFDSNDEPGNDSSEDNNIVRSFDQITWTLENTLKLKEEQSGESYSGGILEVKAEVPQTIANYIKWDTDSMKWAENAEISSDGSVFSAQYTLSDSEITIPGKQTIVIVLKILGAPNGLEIKPKFSVNLQGNDDSEKYILEDTSTNVSAAPNYNVKLEKNSYLGYKTELNFGDGNVKGRIYGYSVALQLCNTNVDKGLKGIEYPQGDIDFDINLQLTRTKFNSTEEEDITDECTPILWNYRENYDNPNGVIEGRTMMFNNVLSKYNRSEVYGVITSDRTQSVYNSGSINMIQNGRRISTKIRNYEIDGIFPQYPIFRNPTTVPIYGNNIGCFSANYFQIFVPDNEASTVEDRNYYLKVSDENFKSTSISGVEQLEQKISTDDLVNIQHVIYRQGSYNQCMMLMKGNSPGNYLGQTYTTGDGKAIIGQYFEVYDKFSIGLGNDENLKSATKFIKFDGDCAEPVLYSDGRKYKKGTFDGDMTFNVWYITKRDGTNWSSQEEMNEARIEDMLYYENIQDIPDGYICIGEYFESIDGEITTATGDNNIVTIRLKVKDTAEIGRTYGFTHTTTDWIDYVDRNLYSIEKQNFSEWPQYTWRMGEQNYIKTEYDENGEIITGTHNGGWQWGQSVLITGADLSIKKNSIDEDNNDKVNYDIGKNEYNVTYKLIPKIAKNQFVSTQIENINLEIVDKLPQGIKYVPGTCNYSEPTIENNADGTTSLKWDIYSCTAGDAINPIIYQAKINEETENGTQYISNVVVAEKIADGEISKIGNSHISNRTATNTIQIINLESYSLYKTTNTPITEINGQIHYKVTAINKTDNPISNFQMLDVLPYNDDGRGTHFNGDYIVSKIELKQTDIITNDNISIDNLNIKITNDDAVRTQMTAKDADLGIGSIWTQVNSSEIINRQEKGFAIIGTLSSKTKLEIDIYLQPNNNKPRDEYNNSATAQTNTETEVMQTPIINVQVIKRKVEGNVWFDKNKNGIIDEEEEYLSGERITLLNWDGTLAKNIYDEEISSILTNENGCYMFEDMKKGNYKIRIEYANEDGKKEITTKDVGVNVEINSKFNDNGLTDVITDLNNTNSPEINVKHLNAGITYKDAKVIVHHYFEGTTTPVILKDGTNAEEQIITGKINDDYNTSIADIPEYYELTKTPLNAQGKMKLNGIEVIYYYKIKEYPYTVKYVDKETGQEIFQQKESEEVEYGTTIRAEDEKIEIEKYTYDSASEESITINTENNQIILYYIKKTGTVITRYIDINKNIEIEQEEQLTGKVDSDYTTTKKNISDYTFVEDSNNTTGKFMEDTISVYYYYGQNAKVVVKYVDEITGEEIEKEDTIDGYESKDYKTQPKEIDDYDLTEDTPENAEGKMTKETIEVVYYYKRPAKVIVSYLDIDTMQKISDDFIIEGKQNDLYTTEEKEIKKYKLIKEKYPENSKGKMNITIDTNKEEKVINDTTYVKYYYKKIEANLKVKKEITNIIVNGDNKNKESHLEKIEINRKLISDTTIRVIYRIIVENTGEVVTDATLEEIIPEGMVMTNGNNKDWTKKDGKAIINIEALKPKETRNYYISLDWINNESSLGTLKNQVQLTNVKNEDNIEENNKEDNKDSAEIVISISTGIQKYLILICILGIVLIMICVFIIKKSNLIEKM